MKRRDYLEKMSTAGIAVGGLTGMSSVAAAASLNPSFVQDTSIGSYGQNYNSVEVRLYTACHDDGCVSVSEAKNVFNDVETALRRIVNKASKLDGALVELWDTDADFSGLSSKSEHYNHADDLIWGSTFDNDGGNNLWLQPNHTHSYPAKYSPSVYKPDYSNATKSSSEADFPHSFAPAKKRDSVYWGANHENHHNMFKGSLIDDLTGSCGNISAHTLASGHYQSDFNTYYSTLMARPYSDELECGDCNIDKSLVDYHGLYVSDCEATAVDRTIDWAKSNNT